MKKFLTKIITKLERKLYDYCVYPLLRRDCKNIKTIYIKPSDISLNKYNPISEKKLSKHIDSGFIKYDPKLGLITIDKKNKCLDGNHRLFLLKKYNNTDPILVKKLPTKSWNLRTIILGWLILNSLKKNKPISDYVKTLIDKFEK